jgi:hypothetical protein
MIPPRMSFTIVMPGVPTASMFAHYPLVRTCAASNNNGLTTWLSGHGQQLHETSHGSITTTQWALQLDEDDVNPVRKLQGRKFGSAYERAPLLCNFVCTAQGRHTHIDYCRDPDHCDNSDCEHISERAHPNPDRPKDRISHATFWARSGMSHS